MISAADIIPLFIVVSLSGAFLTSILGSRLKVLPDILGGITTFMLLFFSVLILFYSGCGDVFVYNIGAWKPPWGITFVLDGLSAFMLVTVNLIAFLIALYSVNYMEKYTSKWKFYTLFLLMVAGMNGIIITGDIFNMYVFLEIASLSAYSLVAFGTERQEVEAAFKYAD